MRRFLTILLVVLLIVVVWAILVAPDYDLDPTVLRGKQAILWSLTPAILLCAILAFALSLERLLSGLRIPDPFLLSPLELSCVRLC